MAVAEDGEAEKDGVAVDTMSSREGTNNGECNDDD